MYLTKEEREELSTLSKEVFGTRNQWQKMINKGHPELITRKVVKDVANEAGEITQEESTEPILTSSGRQQFSTKYYTVESVKEHMLALKKQRDEIIAMINKQNEERKAKAEQERALMDINQRGGGSAL